MWYHLRKIVRAGCYPPNKVETKDYDAMIDGSNIRTCGNIIKTIIGHIEEYKTGYLCYFYFKSNCNLIAIDLTKQQGLDADLKAMQQIIYIGDLDWTVNTKKKIIIQELQETTLEFLQRSIEVRLFLRLSSNMNGNRKDEADFVEKLLWINRYFSSLQIINSWYKIIKNKICR